MNYKIDPNKYILDYFKENEWTILKGQEKKKHEYSKQNLKLIKAASEKLKKSKFQWFDEENSRNKTVHFLDSIKKESTPSSEDEDTAADRDAFSNCRKLAKVLFKSAKNNLNLIETSVKEESSGNEEISGPRIKHCYPRRSLVNITTQKEDDLTSEDEYLHCQDCEKDYKGPCPGHGPMLHACDKPVDDGDEKATATLPDFLSIGVSALPKAGLGVWCEVPLPKGVVFGPYLGHITKNQKQAQSSGYAWQIMKRKKPVHFVEAAHTKESNWLRYINCAISEDQQNLVAFQYHKQIYYKTYKPVMPYTELLVWYGDNFAQELGIDISSKNSKPSVKIAVHPCKECSDAFPSKKALKRHMKSHSATGEPDQKHKCAYCLYFVNNSSDLQSHLFTHHKDPSVPHTCPTCGKSFLTSANLRAHSRTHSGHNCPSCVKIFSSSSNLARHKRAAHAEESPFRCATCGRGFKEDAALGRHERCHAHQRPFKCPKCHYRAERKGSLMRHVVFRHTKKFPFVCHYCRKGFIRLKDLDAHVEYNHFDTQAYRDMVKKRYLENRDGRAGYSGTSMGGDLPKGGSTSDLLKNGRRKKLVSVKKEPGLNAAEKEDVFSRDSIKNFGDLRRFFEQCDFGNVVEQGDVESVIEEVIRKLNIVMIFRKDRYWEATMMPNLTDLGGLKTV
ncbi:hypothetical protein JTE90_029336 [Oedothorax gibbosus]|uniref:Histone-lysine N-methyltransferase PRDM9 n=1 Tax=Oedothorax gibbosus TaxID=931172 RepID=A0AAV6UHW4_9ARAC|nr:hypothetical protein JTE90_029336 [Oedothorax gibbosus]